MANNSIYGSTFYLTSRAGEQLPVNNYKKEETADIEIISSYNSTKAQEHVTNPNQNNAIRYSAIADFSLRNSSALNNYNNYLKKVHNT